jgi:glutamate transport system permease protein
VKVITDNWPQLWAGIQTTVRLTFGAFAIGLLVGFAIAIFRLSPVRPLRGFAAAYTNLMVNSPLLFLMLFMFYGVTKLGVIFSSNACAMIAMGAYLGGYIAEALRAGFNAVSNGQAEAARAVGLTFGQTLRHVVMPQAIRSSFGPLGVLLNASFRNIGAAGAIGARDLIFEAKDVSERTAQNYPLFVFQFLVIAVLAALTAIASNALDKKYAVKR